MTTNNLRMDNVRSDIAMMRTPDGHNKLELTTCQQPPVIGAELYRRCCIRCPEGIVVALAERIG